MAEQEPDVTLRLQLGRTRAFGVPDGGLRNCPSVNFALAAGLSPPAGSAMRLGDRLHPLPGIAEPLAAAETWRKSSTANSCLSPKVRAMEQPLVARGSAPP